MARTELVGLEELLKMFGDLEKLPQKCVNKASKKGAMIALLSARKNAPKGETGNLRKGIVLKAEKTKTKGKKVQQVTFSSKYNDKFVKITKDGKRYYYPASQEYGWIDKNGVRHEGKHFMRDSVMDNASDIEKTIIDEFISNMEKVR